MAYELLFRNALTGPAVISDGTLATAKVIVGALCDFGMQRVLGPYEGYINMDNETLLGMPMAEIVEELKLAPDISGALLVHSGALGRLLAIQEWLEEGEVRNGITACKQFTGFNLGDLVQDQLEALRWAHDLGRRVDDEQAAGNTAWTGNRAP